jgi:RNA polymerase sigma-70 factor (ECF subfamily)
VAEAWPRRIYPVKRDVTSIDAAPGAASRDASARESGPTDDDLMAGLIARRITALEQLYDRYSALVFSVSLRVLYDWQLAEDVTQEVFLRLWQRPESYDPTRGRLLSWLMSVTRNRAIDERRKLSRRVRSEDGEEPLLTLRDLDARDDPVLGLALAETRAVVRKAMQSLPPAQRQVVELAYFGGLTQTEIADKTGVPLGTVKTRVRLAMRKLRDALEAEGQGLTP